MRGSALVRLAGLLRLLPVGTCLPRIGRVRRVRRRVAWQRALVALLPENDARVRRTVAHRVRAIRGRGLAIRTDAVQPDPTHPCRCGRCVLGGRSLSPCRPLSLRAPRGDERTDCKDPDQAAHHGFSNKESRPSPAQCLPDKALKVPRGHCGRQIVKSWRAVTYTEAPAWPAAKSSICMDNRTNSIGTPARPGRFMTLLPFQNRTGRADFSDRA